MVAGVVGRVVVVVSIEGLHILVVENQNYLRTKIVVAVLVA